MITKMMLNHKDSRPPPLESGCPNVGKRQRNSEMAVPMWDSANGNSRWLSQRGKRLTEIGKGLARCGTGILKSKTWFPDMGQQF